jgi:uncharacterized protein YaiL (DUF2058 family)
MANLRDQLLKAGLIDKKARHLAEQEERARAKAARSDKRVALELQEAEAEKLRRQEEDQVSRRAADREREAVRLSQQQALERLHRLESVIDRNRVEQRVGRRRFYFVAGGARVGLMDVHERQACALEDGELCIVRDPRDPIQPFKIMDSAGLAELRSIDPAALVFYAPEWKPLDPGGWSEPGAVEPHPMDPLPTAQPAAPDQEAHGRSPEPPQSDGPASRSGTESGTSTSR